MSESDHRTPTFKHNYDGIDMGEGRLELPKRITVANQEGRAWFARGWLHLLNFNHEEAMECFKHCIHLDDACVMALWGIGELYFLLIVLFEDEAQYENVERRKYFNIFLYENMQKNYHDFFSHAKNQKARNFSRFRKQWNTVLLWISWNKFRKPDNIQKAQAVWCANCHKRFGQKCEMYVPLLLKRRVEENEIAPVTDFTIGK